jgi:FKBP-type peptidyl-prolyl cis-trans isomerase 2
MSKAKVTSEGGAGAAAVAKGDIVRIDFTGWSVESDGDRMFDTTVKSDAEAGDIFNEKVQYKPMAMVAGEGRVFKGLDAAIVGSTVGGEKEISFPASEGAGERDPKNYTVRPLREFLRQEIEPEIGKRVVVGDKSGYIVAVSSGRVRVDFNDRLAGRKLKYKFTIREKLDKTEDKVLAIVEMGYGSAEGFKAEAAGADGIDIILSDMCKYDEKWFVSKYKIVSDLREIMGLAKIRFVEEYVKKADKAEAKKEHDHEHDHEGHEHKHDEDPAGDAK